MIIYHFLPYQRLVVLGFFVHTEPTLVGERGSQEVIWSAVYSTEKPISRISGGFFLGGLKHLGHMKKGILGLYCPAKKW